jgi:hypothetical protein
MNRALDGGFGASALAASGLAVSVFEAAGFDASDLEGSCFGGGGAGTEEVAAGCVSTGSAGVVAGLDCTDDGGVAAGCVCSTGDWGCGCGDAAGCCCAAANSEPPNAADINSFPKSCCRLTNQSSMRNPYAGLHRQKHNRLVAVQRQARLTANRIAGTP